jgi:hypothetical protein
VTKPSTFEELVDLVNLLSEYWLRFARLPSVV